MMTATDFYPCTGAPTSLVSLVDGTILPRTSLLAAKPVKYHHSAGHYKAANRFALATRFVHPLVLP
jgi:hypothetical protein